MLNEFEKVISKVLMDKLKNMRKYQPKMIELSGWTFKAKVQPLFQGHFPFCHSEGGKSSQLGCATTGLVAIQKYISVTHHISQQAT